ncbi:MAG: acyl carrier protein [Bacteroidota bacterium]
MEKQLEKRLVNTLERVIGYEVGNLNFEKDLGEQLSLDSIQLVQLFSEVEDEFKVELPFELMESKNINEFLIRFEKEISKNKIN